MANWSDPRTGGASAARAGLRGAAYDAGLRSYMLSIYNYMMAAVALSGAVALGFFLSGAAETVFLGGGMLRWVITFAPLGFILALNFGVQRMSQATMQLVFWGFAAVMGLSLSTIFLVYGPLSIAGAFFSTAAAFAGLSLYGYTTKTNLGPLGTFMIMGLIGLIVASLINIFLQSSIVGTVISIVGVLIFAGLTAYDTQRAKLVYDDVAGTDWEGRAAIMSALQLYLDFINMFLYILRLFGNRD